MHEHTIKIKLLRTREMLMSLLQLLVCSLRALSAVTCCLHHAQWLQRCMGANCQRQRCLAAPEIVFDRASTETRSMVPVVTIMKNLDGCNVQQSLGKSKGTGDDTDMPGMAVVQKMKDKLDTRDQLHGKKTPLVRTRVGSSFDSAS
jgi:hypothetical protein